MQSNGSMLLHPNDSACAHNNSNKKKRDWTRDIFMKENTEINNIKGLQ